jgi:hypothetical protein
MEKIKLNQYKSRLDIFLITVIPLPTLKKQPQGSSAGQLLAGGDRLFLYRNAPNNAIMERGPEMLIFTPLWQWERRPI